MISYNLYKKFVQRFHIIPKKLFNYEVQCYLHIITYGGKYET